MVSVTEAKSHVGDVPGASQRLVLCEECERYIFGSLNNHALSEPVNCTPREVVKISLTKVAFPPRNGMDARIPITSKYDSISLSQANGDLNVLRCLGEVMISVICRCIRIVAHEL